MSNIKQTLNSFTRHHLFITFLLFGWRNLSVQLYFDYGQHSFFSPIYISSIYTIFWNARRFWIYLWFLLTRKPPVYLYCISVSRVGQDKERWQLWQAHFGCSCGISFKSTWKISYLGYVYSIIYCIVRNITTNSLVLLCTGDKLFVRVLTLWI